MNASGTDGDAPPPGTAIVRPLRHVQAVRERYLRRFADPAEAAASRSARAWGWALGESNVSPVTDRATTVPPRRSDIETEIAAADERRLRGDRENRADAAATVLRWLIGDDDHVPVRHESPGELVGGFGHIVRTQEQIADVLAQAVEGQRRARAQSWDTHADSDDRQVARRAADHLDGVVATLAWILGDRTEAPITRGGMSRELTTRNIKAERVHAEDAIEHAHQLRMADGFSPRWYAEGVNFTVSWLLGDTTIPLPEVVALRSPH